MRIDQERIEILSRPNQYRTEFGNLASVALQNWTAVEISTVERLYGRGPFETTEDYNTP
jgi:hypothetical protein